MLQALSQQPSAKQFNAAVSGQAVVQRSPLGSIPILLPGVQAYGHLSHDTGTYGAAMLCQRCTGLLMRAP